VRDKPHLIQRVKRRASSLNKAGVDSDFAFDYMGSSEFEWGALPKALAEMRGAVDASWKPEKLTYKKFVAWYIGPEKPRAVAKSFFERNLDDRYDQALKEISYVHDSYTGTENNWRRDVIGWWCIDEGMPFALFKSKEDAELWLEHMRKPKPAQ
jgi:hypothetical protein